MFFPVTTPNLAAKTCRNLNFHCCYLRVLARIVVAWEAFEVNRYLQVFLGRWCHDGRQFSHGAMTWLSVVELLLGELGELENDLSAMKSSVAAQDTYFMARRRILVPTAKAASAAWKQSVSLGVKTVNKSAYDGSASSFEDFMDADAWLLSHSDSEAVLDMSQFADLMGSASGMSSIVNN
ncbi:unnamed protein product [Phytophthora lilii]|uniref:Unnamed protein product n=1 Tax=Phytophthora lilii TaxID=2077276 RepID=A0A9W6WUR8_9STRA|nr:unnamed protein product [Phytophthora lilii]